MTTPPEVLSGYKRFTKRFQEDNAVFAKLAEEGQHPKVLWIGCSDSRVVPEIITGADPGELFMVRNIANIVPPAEDDAASVGAAIEYAVRHLKVEHAVICGHTECGGIKALQESSWPEADAHIEAWIDWARPAWEGVLAAETSPEESYLECIKANVLLQCENLRGYSCVAEAEAAGTLRIHGWLYGLHTGTLFAYDSETREWTTLVEEQ